MARPHGARMTKEERDDYRDRAWRLHIAGRAAPLIAKELNLSRQTICTLIKQAAAEVRADRDRIGGEDADLMAALAADEAVISDHAIISARMRQRLDRLARRVEEDEQAAARGGPPANAKLAAVYETRLAEFAKTLADQAKAQVAANEHRSKMLGLMPTRLTGADGKGPVKAEVTAWLRNFEQAADSIPPPEEPPGAVPPEWQPDDDSGRDPHP